MGMIRSVRRAKRGTPDFIALRMSDEDSHEDNEAINIESIIHAEAMRRSADDKDSSDDDESEADFDVEDDDEGPQNSDNSDGDGDKESGVGKKRRAITRGPVRCPLSSPCLHRGPKTRKHKTQPSGEQGQNTKTQNTRPAGEAKTQKHKAPKHSTGSTVYDQDFRSH